MKEATPGSLASTIREDSPCRAITIDAFPNQWINRTYTITGTTTFPPGTELLVELSPTEIDLTVDAGTKQQVASMSGVLGSATVERGNWSTNLWFLTLDQGKMAPDQQNYLVNVSNNRIDNRTYATIEGGTWCSRRLVLPG